jgi:DHA1 family bicyclomycin/chloramphenicol resistance-like MFS transporter
MVHAGDSLSRGRRLTYIFVLGALTALGPFTVDMYLPAFPAVEAEFSSSTATVQLTLAATMIGFALGQLIVGPWSDRVGRRMPLIVATAVHVAASLAVALSPTIEWLIVLRVLQGLGAAAGAVVAMAVVRDLFTGVPMVRMLSRLALVSGLAPVVAPLVGSQLMLVMSWRGTFVVLAAFSAIVLIATALFVRETLPVQQRHEAGHSTTLQRFRVLLTDRAFVGTVLMAGMNFSGLFAYLAFSPFLFQQVYTLNAQQYGVLFAVNSFGVIIGVQTASYLARTIGPQWILAGANILALLSASTIVVLDLAEVGLLGVLIPLFLFITACGLSFPCLTALALARHGSEAGTAASLLGAANFGIAAAVTPIVGLFGAQRALPMGAVMLACAVLAGLLLWLVIRPRTVPALTR